MMRGRRTGESAPETSINAIWPGCSRAIFYRGSVRVVLRIGIRGRLLSRLSTKESDPLVPARSRREAVAADQGKFARELHSHALHERTTRGRRVHTRHPDEHGAAERAAR